MLLLVSALAMWSETLRINATVNTGEVSVEFVSWMQSDEGADPQDEGFHNEEEKDVASTTINVIQAGNHEGAIELLVTIDNAYPGYMVDLSFIIKNTGTIPVKLMSFNVDGVNETALSVIYEEPEACIQLHPGDELPFNMKLSVKQEADELSTYTFEVTLVFAQWNEVVCQPVLGSISGYFWIDANEDGFIDPIEQYYSDGAIVELYYANDTFITSTITGLNGYYVFSGLAAGTYKIKGITPYGYYNTTPTIIIVTLLPGQSLMNNNFGINYAPVLFASKDFRHTDVSWGCNPFFGNYLDNNGIVYYVNVTLDSKGKIKNTIPGVFYGVITIEGNGLSYLNIVDVFEEHFKVKGPQSNPDVHVVLYNATTNCASDITNKATINVSNANNTVNVGLSLTQPGLSPLSSGDTLYVYIKFERSEWLKDQKWDELDDKIFDNNAYIQTDIGDAQVNASIQLRLHPSSD